MEYNIILKSYIIEEYKYRLKDIYEIKEKLESIGFITKLDIPDLNDYDEIDEINNIIQLCVENNVKVQINSLEELESFIKKFGRIKFITSDIICLEDIYNEITYYR